MRACSACNSYVRGPGACPHCGFWGASPPGPHSGCSVAGRASAAILLGLAITGCPQPKEDTGDTADTAADTDTDTTATDTDTDTSTDTDTTHDTGIAAMYGMPYVDDDGDGYSAASAGGDDCNDADASVHPGAKEHPGDGVDSNCNGADDT